MATINQLPAEARRFAPALSPEASTALLQAIVRAVADGLGDWADRLRTAACETPDAGGAGLPLVASLLLLADLAEQGWGVQVIGAECWLLPPAWQASAAETRETVKARLRQRLEQARERQLREPATQAFLREISRRRPHAGRTAAVTDLVDDGASLATALEAVARLPEAERAAALSAVVQPEVVICDDTATCPHTGLLLRDVWRYFRHTWSLEYRSTPGRSLPLLVRNVARPYHPVIGIAMLANAPLRLRPRDLWLGWTVEALEARLRERPADTADLARALRAALDEAVAEVRGDDLLAAADPDQAVPWLRQQAQAAAAHRQAELQAHETARQQGQASGLVGTRKLPENADGEVDWQAGGVLAGDVASRRMLRRWFRPQGLRIGDGKEHGRPSPTAAWAAAVLAA